MSIFIKLQLNQYAIVNSNQPTYDDDGNMLTNGNWSYTWNGENRLIRAVNSATEVKLEFAYDYMGRRIFKKVYNGEILEKHLSFAYDGYKLIEERNALDSNVAVRKYVWQPESLDRDVPLTVYDVVSEKTYYYHTDANKNVTELSDESGNVVAHYEYSPFGSLTKVTGDYAGNNPFRFSSEYYDEETGLVYYNYRYYNPELGRWISRDPIEEQGGYNLYGMIRNNPLYGWDSLGYGHAWWCYKKYTDAISDFWDKNGEIIQAYGEGFLEGLSDGAAGVGDGLTTIPLTGFSLTEAARNALGINNINDQSSYDFSHGLGLFARDVIAAKGASLYKTPNTLYHFTSKEAAAKIAVEGLKPTTSGGLFGNNVIYATRSNSALIAKLQGAKSTETVVEISTTGLKVKPALFPGTFKIIP